MVSIRAAKEIKGTLTLPPSPDLFFLTVALSLATRCSVHIDNMAQTPRIQHLCEWFRGRVSVSFEGPSCDISQASQASDAMRTPLCLYYPDIPYPDIAVFLLLAVEKTLELHGVPQRRVEQWQRCVERAGCAVTITSDAENRTLVLERIDHFRIPEVPVDIEDIHPFIGLALGLRRPVECVIGQTWSSPLRSLLASFGYLCNVKSLSPRKDEDPLMRRLRFMKTGKKSEGPLQFSISADFSKAALTQARIDLPGDETLAGLMIAAKCLVPKGSLVVENIGLESWNTQILQLVKNMGCTLGMQESNVGSFGSVGSVVVQKINLFGRKVDCRPRFQFASQLPAMVVIASFAQGQSIFRNLEDWRIDEPDAVEQINACIATLGARYGEMPDGIVVEGAKQFDGFDLSQPLPAHVAGAFAIAGLKCIGTTTIADEAINQRWPGFNEMISSVCDFKESN